MLIIDGALALWNGALVMSRKLWCECVSGGTWCGGECRCEAGRCCKCVWHADADPDAPCPEGMRFFTWGNDDVCCGCLPLDMFDPEQNGGLETDEEVKAALCCPECVIFDNGVPDWASLWRNESGECSQRCCVDCSCECRYPSDCSGESLSGNCNAGCPVKCCLDDGSCQVREPFDCPADRRHCTGQECETACVGVCCKENEDGVYEPATTQRWDDGLGDWVDTTQLTKSECDAAGGKWQGPGSTACSNECCTEVTSNGTSLTFTPSSGPRCSDLDNCGYQVTVTVKTGQPIYIHGMTFGDPYEVCDQTTTFVVCNGEFRVTPAPCTGNFNNLEIQVCWADAAGPETLRFRCCGGRYLLGNCDCSCVTTLLYDGPGCTSSANLEMRGDAVIEANGSGPLVLLNDITNTGNCNRTLTLKGTSDSLNEVRGIVQPSSILCNFIKDGPGRWRWNIATKIPNGSVLIKNGILQFATDAIPPSIDIGDTSATASGVAMMLIEENINTGSADLNVLASSGTQRVLVGGRDDAIMGAWSMQIRRPITLFAATGGLFTFEGFWYGDTTGSQCEQDITIGTEQHAGKVMLATNGTLSTNGELIVAYGDVEVFPNDTTLIANGGITINAGAKLTLTTLASNPGDLATGAELTGDTLTVAFSGDPATGDEYVLFNCPTNNTYTNVVLTGTTATGTYDSVTSTLTID